MKIHFDQIAGQRKLKWDTQAHLRQTILSAQARESWPSHEIMRTSMLI